jgi:hypothetical protein
MANPERSPTNIPPSTQSNEVPFTLHEIEQKLEVVDEIENVIERTEQREKLLELLDMYFSEE